MSAVRVALWKESWLPASETFIRAQQDATAPAVVACIGLRRVPGPLARPDDVIVFGTSLPARIRARRFVLTGRDASVDAAVRAARPDLLHAHFVTGGMLVRRTAKGLGLPLVVTLHGRDVAIGRRIEGLRGRRWRARARAVFRDAALVLAVSEHVRRRAIDLGCPPAKVVVQHIGIRPAETAPREHRAGVLAVGRLVPKKGFDDLLAAAALLPPALRETRITIVGDGPLRGDLEARAAALGLTVTFAGALPAAAVAEAMADAAVVCVPSRTAPDGDEEGLPIVLLEACAAACAVVATTHAGIPEVIDDDVSGLLVAEADPAALAAALGRALGDRALAQRLGSAASARVRADFDLARQAEDLVRTYERVSRRSVP